MKHLIIATALAMAATPALAQTVILVRHGEKADASADPVLSEAGQARAQALAAVTANAGLTHAFSTPLQRTRQTITPAADAAGLTVVPIALTGGGAAHIARVAETLRALGPDDVALVAGHSNTVPEIVKALGVADAAAMSECEYDRIYVIELKEGAARAVVSRYGAPTEPC